MDSQDTSLLALPTKEAADPLHAAHPGLQCLNQREAGFSERLIEYLSFRGSTTFFLEAVSGASVNVEVLHQYVEQGHDEGDVLRRLSRLHVRHPLNIVVVAESAVHLRFMDARQRCALNGCVMGIGKLLDPDNLGLLEKQDIETTRIEAPPSLRTRLEWAISRRFALKFNGVLCAEIREIVNSESLERAQ